MYLALAAGCWCAAPLFLLDSKNDIGIEGQLLVDGAWLGLITLWANSIAAASKHASRSICACILRVRLSWPQTPPAGE